jgi:hypothetical protein
MSMRNCVELKRRASLLHELGRGHADAPAAFFYRHFRALRREHRKGPAPDLVRHRGREARTLRRRRGLADSRGTGGCYCDLSPADCVVKRHPCWTHHERSRLCGKQGCTLLREAMGYVGRGSKSAFAEHIGSNCRFGATSAPVTLLARMLLFCWSPNVRA